MLVEHWGNAELKCFEDAKIAKLKCFTVTVGLLASTGTYIQDGP